MISALGRPVVRVPQQCAVFSRATSRLVPCRAPTMRAVRREIEPVNFGDVYLAMQERVATPGGTIPKGDGRLMVESIRSLEHAQRTLQLIARHVASKRQLAGALELDWPTRKKWLARICELALRIPNAKPLVLDVFANVEAFGLSTYFAAEMVVELAEKGAETQLLVRMVELFRSRRPPGDKGVASAYHKLREVLKERKDEEAAKTATAALRKYLEAPTPTPAAAPAAAEAGPAPPAAAAAAPST